MIDPCLWTQEDYTIYQKCELRHQWMWESLVMYTFYGLLIDVMENPFQMISRSMLLRKRITASVL